MNRLFAGRTARCVMKLAGAVLLSVLSVALLLGISVNAKYPYANADPSFANLTSSDLAVGGPGGAPFPNPGMAADFFALKAKNSDEIGYLAIKNVCYYPIMYSGDNDYYLHRDTAKQYSINGSLFLSMDNHNAFDNIAVIYGHNMKDGTMFGSLPQYRNEHFYATNDPLELFDGTNLRFYRPFTVMLFTDGKDAIDVTKTGADKTAYVKYLESRSLFPSDYTGEDNANLLFLSTCEYDFANARLVVGFYQIASYEYQA